MLLIAPWALYCLPLAGCGETVHRGSSGLTTLSLDEAMKTITAAPGVPVISIDATSVTLGPKVKRFIKSVGQLNYYSLEVEPVPIQFTDVRQLYRFTESGYHALVYYRPLGRDSDTLWPLGPWKTREERDLFLSAMMTMCPQLN